MTTRTTVIRRILVALDASPSSLAALESAARFAAELEAELLGLYVEDESLIRGAALPGARVVGSFSGAVRPVQQEEIEQHLRTQAAKARQALEMIAGRARLRWSFRVARGSVTSELLAASKGADLISLGRCGWSMIQSGRIGRTTTNVLSRAGAPVLLLGRALRTGNAVVAVYDDSESGRRGLDLARQLASSETTPLVVVVAALGGEAETLEKAARADLEALGVNRKVRFHSVPPSDGSLLRALERAEGIGVLILPNPDIFEKGIQGLLERVQCPILVVG